MTKRLAFRNARLIDPATGLDTRGGLLVENGKIADVGAKLFNTADPHDPEVVDCKGLVLAPGLIDMRVFTGEPGSEHRETLASASEAAAAGGVTTIVTMPNTDPVIDEAALVDFIKRRAAATAKVRVAPMAALTHALRGERMTEIGLLREAGAVAFTDGDRSVSNTRVLRRALSYAATFGALVAGHAEDPDLSNGASPVTCGVSAHHLTMNELDVGSYLTFRKVSPPLRSEADRAAMVEGVAEGHIDVIVSSHDPQAADTKRLPFAAAAFGAVGLETLLPAALTIVHNGHAPLIDVLKSVTSTPAKILGLPEGRLAKGAHADLVLFDPDEPFILDADTLHSRARNTAFEGRKFQGRARMTFVGGECVFDRAKEGKH